MYPLELTMSIIDTQAVAERTPASGRYALNTTAYDETALIEASRNGDAEAFGLMVEKYMPRALAFATRMTGNREDAEDIVQEAFVRAYGKLEGFRGESGFYTWFYRLLSNACLDHMRKGTLIKRFFYFARGDNPDNDYDPVATAPDTDRNMNPGTGVERSEDAEAINAALMKLSPRQRAVFLLRHEEGLKTAEVAETLGISEGAVKSHLVRAISALRKELSDYGG